jgi:hypothetical protein
MIHKDRISKQSNKDNRLTENIISMKDSANRHNTNADRCPLRLPLKVNPESKIEIHLRFCFATLPLVPAFGLLLLPVLLPNEQSVMN